MGGNDPVGAVPQSCGNKGGSNVVSPQKKSWIAIKLVDQNGKPVPGEEYRITLPDGSQVEGDVDANGFARINGIDPGTCQITFPNLDKDIWQPA
jgi:type VI secretion system secreted protein VgrG